MRKIVPLRDRRLLRLPEVRYLTGLSTSEIYRRMSRETFPPSIRIGPRQVAWDSELINGWILVQLGEFKEARNG